MSSIYHQADLDGCEKAFNIINQYPNYITSWTHTPGDKDSYDIQMTCTYPDGLVREEEGECKDRQKPLYTLEYLKVIIDYHLLFHILYKYLYCFL